MTTARNFLFHLQWHWTNI